MLLVGVSFLGGFAGDVTYDIAKDQAKAVIVAAAPKVAHGIDALAYKELPPAEAAKVHGAVKFLIAQSPEKSEHALPARCRRENNSPSYVLPRHRLLCSSPHFTCREISPVATLAWGLDHARDAGNGLLFARLAGNAAGG